MDKEPKKYNNFKWLLDYSSPYWKIIALFFTACTIMTITNIARAEIIKELIDAATEGQSQLLLRISIIYFSVVTIRAITHFFRGYTSDLINQNIIRDIQNDVLTHLTNAKLAETDKFHSGEIMARFNDDIKKTGESITLKAIRIIQDLLMVLGSIGYLLYLNWQLTMIIIAMGPLLPLLNRYFNPRIEKAASERQELEAKLYKFVQQNIQSNILIKVFNLHKSIFNRFGNLWAVKLEKFMEARKYNLSFESVSRLLKQVIYVSVAFVGSIFIVRDQLTVGGLVAFLQLLNNFLLPLTGLAPTWASFKESLVSVDRIRTLLDISPEGNIDELKLASKSSEIKETEIKPPVKIKFNEVSFEYKENEKILKNISFEANNNEIVGLVGPSGAGKTTIFKILLGLYQSYDGAIYLNNIELKKVNKKVLRQMISYVSQEQNLISATIKENIKFGKEGATEIEIKKAAKLANAHNFITRFKDGYDTELSELGKSISGGQKQRLAIARAILKNAPVFLFDEITSSLDYESEKMIKESIKQLAKNKTCLLIAHKLSTVKMCDRIITIKDGDIAGIGTHEELLAKGGTYTELYKTQIKEDQYGVVE